MLFDRSVPLVKLLRYHSTRHTEHDRQSQVYQQEAKGHRRQAPAAEIHISLRSAGDPRRQSRPLASTASKQMKILRVPLVLARPAHAARCGCCYCCWRAGRNRSPGRPGFVGPIEHRRHYCALIAKLQNTCIANGEAVQRLVHTHTRLVVP